MFSRSIIIYCMPQGQIFKKYVLPYKFFNHQRGEILFIFLFPKYIVMPAQLEDAFTMGDMHRDEGVND